MNEVWVKHHKMGAVLMSREQIEHLRNNGVEVVECSEPILAQSMTVPPAAVQTATYVPATEAPAPKRRGRPRKDPV